MKAEIHPEYHELTARCSCGAEYETRSTLKELQLEVCSNCHPFYTGKQHFVDSAGMVERFKRKFGKFDGAAAREQQKAALRGKKAKAAD